MSVGTRVLVSVNAAQSVALSEVFQSRGFEGFGKDEDDQSVGKWCSCCCCLSLSGFGRDLSDHGHRMVILVLVWYEGWKAGGGGRRIKYRIVLQMETGLLGVCWK